MKKLVYILCAFSVIFLSAGLLMLLPTNKIEVEDNSIANTFNDITLASENYVTSNTNDYASSYYYDSESGGTEPGWWNNDEADISENVNFGIGNFGS